MIIRGKNYIFSRGVAFYPEKEMMLVKEQAEKGWHLKKLNFLGFLEFEKGAVEHKKFSVDFFSGKKEELEDYLTIYQEAGWECVADYRKKYFYFKADPNVPTIYSDEESYLSRMHQEWVWNFGRNLFYIPIGLFLFLVAYLTRQPENTHDFWYVLFRTFLFFFGTIFTVMPLAVVINVLFSIIVYKDRKKFYSRPELFAKRQHFWRDMVLLMIIGALCGMLLSVMLGDII